MVQLTFHCRVQERPDLGGSSLAWGGMRGGETIRADVQGGLSL